jgi:hypothetical protein
MPAPAPVPAARPAGPAYVDEMPEEEEPDQSSLDVLRDGYVDGVIKDDRYASLIASMKYNFFNDDDNSALDEIEEMNNYWNAFRNAVYDEYYEDDYVLRAGIDYDAYAEDERLLRLYTDAYYDFFEYLSNEFVMTYEYANGTALDMYPQIESELQMLGRPVAKLNLLVELYNIIQMQGGTAALLEAIYIKDSADEKADAQDEGLVVLSTATEVTVRDNLTGDETKYNMVETVEHDVSGTSEFSVVYNDAGPSDISAQVEPGDFDGGEVGEAADEAEFEEISETEESALDAYEEPALDSAPGASAGEEGDSDDVEYSQSDDESRSDESQFDREDEADAGDEYAVNDNSGESDGDADADEVEDEDESGDEEYIEVSYN